MGRQCFAAAQSHQGHKNAGEQNNPLQSKTLDKRYALTQLDLNVPPLCSSIQTFQHVSGA